MTTAHGKQRKEAEDEVFLETTSTSPRWSRTSARKLVSVHRVGERDDLAIPNFRKHQRTDHPKSRAQFPLRLALIPRTRQLSKKIRGMIREPRA